MAISSSEYNKYLQEILTFADDANQIATDDKGNILFERFNKTMSVKLLEVNGRICVEYNGRVMPYKTFLAKELACMDIMAKHIKDKDPEINNVCYIDGPAQLSTAEENYSDTALKLLDKECTREVFMGSKICFVTANAGHGKTMLLRQYQHEQAKKYINGKTDFLFIHIDLHGHDLRKLDTVIMYEMGGVLRMPGIYTNSIITLMKNGLIVLGVDGFDELAVETGGEKAIGSFSNLVRELDSQGVLIAASRRTFFNTQDYVKRKGYLDDVRDACFCFDEIRLQNWGKEQCSEYMEYMIDDVTPEQVSEEYDNILSFLGTGSSNPLVERPFLFTNIVTCANNENKTVSEYLHEGGKSVQGIERIITSFIRREVDKWNSNNLTDKQGYLTFSQHKRFLANVAEEMWLSQREYISLEVLEFDLSILLEDWKVLPNLQPDIIKMSKSHAFMVADSHGESYRRFDHEEFRNYFLAKALEYKIICTDLTKGAFGLRKPLSIGQLPDSVALFLAQSNEDYDRVGLIKCLLAEVKKEQRTSYLHTNVGTLIPYLLDGQKIDDTIIIDSRLVFSSIAFEHKTLENIIFQNCFFVNVSFVKTKLKNVKFINCEFTDIRFHEVNDCIFDNVTYDDATKIHRIREFTEGNEIVSTEFIPEYIESKLFSIGLKNESKHKSSTPVVVNSEYRKAVRRFLNKFNASSIFYEKNLKEDPNYNSKNYDLYVDEIIPSMIKYGIIKEIENNNTRQQSSKAWSLDKYSLQSIYEAEKNTLSPIYAFWKEVNSNKQ